MLSIWTSLDFLWFGKEFRILLSRKKKIPENVHKKYANHKRM